MSVITNIDQEDGYEYIETARPWKAMCSTLPCFAEMWWPGYLTKVVRTRIRGHEVVIQLWKGWCQRFLGHHARFPGGIGAEVGIYRKVAEGERASTQPGPVGKQPHLFAGPTKHLDKTLHGARHRAARTAANVARRRHRVDPIAGHAIREGPAREPSQGDPDGEVWYPYPELGTSLWFKLVNPLNGEEFFHTASERTYWLTRWMDPTCYRQRYQRDHVTPPHPASYRLHYTIDGVSYPSW